VDSDGAGRDAADGAVVVVGSANIDLVFSGLDAIPAPGQTTAAAAFTTVPGGKGANQAAAAATLGASVEFVAAVGDDGFGEQTIADLAARGVGLARVRRVAAPTGVAGIAVDVSGENVVIVAPGANAMLRPDSAHDATALAADGRRRVLLLCLEIPMDTVLAWAVAGRRLGWTVVLNPAPAAPLPAELLAVVDVLTPNETELAALGDPAALLAAGVGAVVTTLGGDGARILDGGGDRAIAAIPVDPVDTTGAGDAFNGALVAGLAAGLGLDAAVGEAVAAGALATLGLGARAALPDRAALASALAARVR